MKEENYLEEAIKHEPIFRAVLRDLKENRLNRPNPQSIPKNLETEADVRDIYEKYSSPDLTEQFTISYFQIDERGRALIGFDDIGNLSKFRKERGTGVELVYSVEENGSVKYKFCRMDWEFKNVRK